MFYLSNSAQSRNIEPDYKIGKLIPLFGSDKPGEVLATVAAIDRRLKATNRDWHDLAVNQSEGEAEFCFEFVLPLPNHASGSGYDNEINASPQRISRRTRPASTVFPAPATRLAAQNRCHYYVVS